MRDIVTQEGFRHIAPRDRLVRHCTNKMRDRLGMDPNMPRHILHAKYRELEAAVEALPPSTIDWQTGDDFNRAVYRMEMWGRRFRVVWDLRYKAGVTVLRGWTTAGR